MSERTSLQDIINYQPDTYLSEEEMSLIKSTFKDNPRLLNVLRKVMLPTVGDPSLPIEEISNDAWLAMRDWAAIPMEEAKALMVGRQEAIKFVAGGIIKLKMLANATEESPYQKALRKKQDSSK